MTMPKERKDVPRDEVHNVVELMLMNPDVGDVQSIEQSNGKYTVTPFPRTRVRTAPKRGKARRSE